jgi:hypothetical protein
MRVALDELALAPIHLSAWKVNSQKFVFCAFSEVRGVSCLATHTSW